jgi:hypothetical protein
MHYLIWEILVEAVLDVHAIDVKIKIFLIWCCNNASFIKRFIEKYLCWYAHGEPYVPHDTMVEMMIRSTSSSRNVHGVVEFVLLSQRHV